jgi:hypothetical protein
MNSKQIIEKVKSLNFPKDQYVVIAGGVLTALGIREAQDIDISVLPELHKKLRESGEWKEETRYSNKLFLLKDDTEINPELSWGEYKTTTREAIQSALTIEDVPFMNLQELKKFKLALGREKDINDIKLIDEYLNKNNL